MPPTPCGLLLPPPTAQDLSPSDAAALRARHESLQDEDTATLAALVRHTLLEDSSEHRERIARAVYSGQFQVPMPGHHGPLPPMMWGVTSVKPGWRRQRVIVAQRRPMEATILDYGRELSPEDAELAHIFETRSLHTTHAMFLTPFSDGEFGQTVEYGAAAMEARTSARAGTVADRLKRRLRDKALPSKLARIPEPDWTLAMDLDENDFMHEYLSFLSVESLRDVVDAQQQAAVRQSERQSRRDNRKRSGSADGASPISELSSADLLRRIIEKADSAASGRRVALARAKEVAQLNYGRMLSAWEQCDSPEILQHPATTSFVLISTTGEIRWIHYIFVPPRLRRRGLGSLLLSLVQELDPQRRTVRSLVDDRRARVRGAGGTLQFFLANRFLADRRDEFKCTTATGRVYVLERRSEEAPLSTAALPWWELKNGRPTQESRVFIAYAERLKQAVLAANEDLPDAACA